MPGTYAAGIALFSKSDRVNSFLIFRPPDVDLRLGEVKLLFEPIRATQLANKATTTLGRVNYNIKFAFHGNTLQLI